MRGKSPTGEDYENWGEEHYWEEVCISVGYFLVLRSLVLEFW
jgi:hypothetical protein